MSCATCHVETGAGPYGMMTPGFAEPYPHPVGMARARAGLPQVNAAEMVQFCMVVPLQAEPLDWASEELAALAAYVEAIRERYRAP